VCIGLVKCPSTDRSCSAWQSLCLAGHWCSITTCTKHDTTMWACGTICLTVTYYMSASIGLYRKKQCHSTWSPSYLRGAMSIIIYFTEENCLYYLNYHTVDLCNMSWPSQQQLRSYYLYNNFWEYRPISVVCHFYSLHWTLSNSELLLKYITGNTVCFFKNK